MINRTPLGKAVKIKLGDTVRELPFLPLSIVVLAELTPRDLQSGVSPTRRQRISIDKQRFDEVMSGFQLRVTLDVADRLTGQRKPLLLELELDNLAAFRPDSVAGQVPITRDLLELRSALEELATGRIDTDAVRDRLVRLDNRSELLKGIERLLEPPVSTVSPPPAPSPAETNSDDALDVIFSLVDTGGGTTHDISSPLEQLIQSFLQSRETRPNSRAVRLAIQTIDMGISSQLNEILHHPEFRRLEATWRGLRFLTDRTDFEEPISIDVIATDRDQLLATLDELVTGPESHTITSQPVSLIVVDQVFDKTPPDIELLKALSERGASLSAPVLATAGPALLGLSEPAELARKSGLKAAFEGPEYTAWRGLRESGPSRWLSLIFNPFLLRPEYGPEGIKSRVFDFVEDLSPEPDPLRLWGNPVWGLAALATRSFARLGWCTDIMGQRAAGTLEDLPVRLQEKTGTTAGSYSIATLISDGVERDLSANGIMTLSAAVNSDRACLRFAPVVHAAHHYQDPIDKARAKLQSTLPFQMFVGRVVNYALLTEGILVPGQTADQIVTGYDQGLRSLLGSAGNVPTDAVEVQVVPSEDDASTQDLKLTVRWPGFQSLPGAGDLTLRWPLLA